MSTPSGNLSGTRERPGNTSRTVILILLTLAAFAANNLLARKALAQTAIDPGTFTFVRTVSGTLMLLLLTGIKRGRVRGNWRAALALSGYLIGFSYAYVTLAIGTGALLLFGAVQASMILMGLISGERLRAIQWFGFAVALAGLAVLIAPGVTAPNPIGAFLMVLAGTSWGVYSLLGRASTTAALENTAGIFLRSIPIVLVPAMGMVLTKHMGWDIPGLVYAVTAGALASGVGYAIWYSALPALSATMAATVQLGVPVITAFSGAVLLRERITLRLSFASLAVLGGIALVILARGQRSRGAAGSSCTGEEVSDARR